MRELARLSLEGAEFGAGNHLPLLLAVPVIAVGASAPTPMGGG